MSTKKPTILALEIRLEDWPLLARRVRNDGQSLSVVVCARRPVENPRLVLPEYCQPGTRTVFLT
jgi:hypothetical protein